MLTCASSPPVSGPAGRTNACGLAPGVTFFGRTILPAR